MGDNIDVASAEDLLPGESMVVEAGDQEIALFNDDVTFEAIGDTCAHQDGVLGEGDLRGTTVTSPWHELTLDVASGEVPGPPAPEGVSRQEVTVENGRAKVSV